MAYSRLYTSGHLQVSKSYPPLGNWGKQTISAILSKEESYINQHYLQLFLKLIEKKIMPNWCCAVGCSNHGMMKRKVSFFTFPSDQERRDKWVAAVKRINDDGTKWLPGKYTVLCSDHFLEGKPNRDPAHPDHVPSLFQHLHVTPKQKETRLKRFVSAVKREILFSSPTPAKRQRKVLSAVNENEQEDEDFYVATPLSAEINKSYVNDVEKAQLNCEIDNLRREKEALSVQNQELAKDIQCCNISYKVVVNNDEKCKFYTGLCWETFFTTFQLLSTFIKPAPRNRKVILEEQFFLTLVKLRHDIAFEMLADLRGVSAATISNIFWLWINLICAKLDFLIKWPDRETLIATLPAPFQLKFPRLTSIIDCFEIFIERPKNLQARAKCYSNYKKHSTVKVFISCTANGVVSFLSCAWGGRVSDIEIVRQSGFIDSKYHLPNDQILADRGFTLQDDFASFCSAELIIPAFTKGKKQLSARDIETSRKISSVRIHIERVIGLIKHRFKILQGTLPISLIKSPNDEADGEELARIDKLLRTCAVLVNMGDGIVYNEND